MTAIVETKPLLKPEQFFAKGVDLSVCGDAIDAVTDEIIFEYEVISPFPLEDIEYDPEDIEEDECYGIAYISMKNLGALIDCARANGQSVMKLQGDMADLKIKNAGHSKQNSAPQANPSFRK